MHLDKRGNISGAANPPDDFDYICDINLLLKVKPKDALCAKSKMGCEKVSLVGYMGFVGDKAGSYLKEGWSMWGNFLIKTAIHIRQ